MDHITTKQIASRLMTVLSTVIGLDTIFFGSILMSLFFLKGTMRCLLSPAVYTNIPEVTNRQTAVRVRTQKQSHMDPKQI